MQVKLKICGMKDPENILAITALKPDYLGFIFYTGSQRFVDGLTPSFVKNIPAGIKRTGVFVNEDLNKVARLALLYGFNAIQLHGSESAAYCLELKKILAKEDIAIVKAFGVDEVFNFEDLTDYQEAADYFLFDTQTSNHGGSGKLFNWKLLKSYTMNKPYFLSGGIGPESITELHKINDTRLYAIDVNSKFELAPGIKDIHKLKDFKARL